MKNILYSSIFMLIYCCNGQNIHKEYYPNGGIKMEVLIKNNLPNGYFIEYFESGNLKTKGNLINGKREGLFYEYNTNSTIFSIDNYVDGVLHGKSIGFDSTLKFYQEYDHGFLRKQRIIDTVTNFLHGNCDGEYCRYYDFPSGRISVIAFNKDTSDVREIFFDSEKGKLKLIKGKLNFLTKDDSLRLDLDYPDWKDQIKIWKKREER